MKKGCLILIGLIFGIGLLGVLLINHLAGEYDKQPKKPGQVECDAAEKFILSYKDKEATGNTPDAAKYAENFARTLRVSRQVLFTEGKAGSATLSKGYFLTYCFVRDDSLAVLVHVPELRRYTEDAKITLAEYSWMLATMEARKAFPKIKKLAVGIKGVMDYSAILSGVITENDDALQSLQTRHPVHSTKPLWPYFASIQEPEQPSGHSPP